MRLYQTVPYNYRAAIVSRIKDHVQPRYHGASLPRTARSGSEAGRADEIELRVATIPTQGGVEDVVMRILAKGRNHAARPMGMSKRNYEELV